jgi:hypothetical protein
MEDKLRQRSKALATTCYDRMCKKIGGNYPIPDSIDATPDPKIPDGLIMPGAALHRHT